MSYIDGIARITGKIAKKQKELNLDIIDKFGIPLTEKFASFKDNLSPLVDFLSDKK
ncbi:MAG: hypothetical protein Q7J06_04605 [Bacteroidales bacterium]|nr:hypothetical protein [Bacteroidales bacterium]